MEYRAVMKKDPSKMWARQANRRMLMLGEFYNRQKSIADEAKRQLEAYQDQMFIKNVEKYSQMVETGTLKGELAKAAMKKNRGTAGNDSILKMIDKIGNLEHVGDDSLAAKKRAEAEILQKELIEKGTMSKAEISELKRRQYLAGNPYRRPSSLKKVIDGHSSALQYIYNKRLRTGIKLSGKMLVGIEIMADGSVSEAKVIQSNMGDQQFENDIVQQIQRWKFRAVPDSLGSLTVNYPFEFYEEN
jgi:TonB family protein